MCLRTSHHQGLAQLSTTPSDQVQLPISQYGSINPEQQWTCSSPCKNSKRKRAGSTIWPFSTLIKSLTSSTRWIVGHTPQVCPRWQVSSDLNQEMYNRANLSENLCQARLYFWPDILFVILKLGHRSLPEIRV